MSSLKSLFPKLFLTVIMAFSLVTANAQSAAVSVNVSGKNLREVLTLVTSQTGVQFSYENSVVDGARLKASGEISGTLSEVMDKLLEETGISCSFISADRAVLSKTVEKKAPAAKKTLKGTVVDAKGEPVIGAAVLVKGTNNGAVTDFDGNFTLEGANPDEALEVSCLGYASKTFRFGKADNLTITLEEDSKLLQEVVVVGFGSQKRGNLTGAVATIGSEELANRPVANAAGALQGLDPSVNITLGTGSPESAYNIDIRGSVSINSSSPLILVDGIETDLRAVNANDIESVSVLKDASASSIYGAKASAGVILVTTKSGKSKDGSTKARINYSGRVGVAQNTTSTDFITCAYDYVTLTNRFYNSYQGTDFYLYPDSTGELQELLDRRNDKTEQASRPWVKVGSDGKYYYYGNFDWFGYLYNRNRFQQEHNISINGGNDDFNYYVSGRYLDQKGIFRLNGDKYDDIAFRSKVSVKILPKLRYSNNISFDRTEMTYPGFNDYEKTIAFLQNHLSPSFLPVNPDGTVVNYTNQQKSSNLGSGMAGALTAGNSWNSKVVRTITINNRLDWDMFDGMKLTAAYGIKFRDPINRYRNNSYQYSRTLDVLETYSQGDNVKNAYTENHYNTTQGNLDIYGTYRHNFGAQEDHHFTAVAGMQYIDYRYSTLQAEQNDLTVDDLATFAVATGEIQLQQSIKTLRTLGFFGRVNYDWKGRYLLEVSGRGDGSSRFAKGSRWGFFPSASMGWRVSEEPFFKNLKKGWNNFKIRLSAGSLGNQQVSSYYTYIDTISLDNVMSYTFDGTSQAYYAAVSAPIASDLTWETVKTYNAGLDLGFLGGRLNLNSDFYIRDTDNMLTSAMTLPSVYGASTPKTNYAAMRTTGFEIYLKWNDSFTLGGKPFNYGITATLGDYVSKITKFKNDDKVLSNYYEGMTLGEIWGYHVDGLFESDSAAQSYYASIDWSRSDDIYTKIFNAKGAGMSQLLAGDMRFVDTNGDKAINQGSGTLSDHGDLQVIGNSLPRYSYSFRFDFNWKGFDLSAFFQGVGKRNWYPNISSNSGQFASDFFGPYAYPMTSFISTSFEQNCWSEDNTDGYFPRQRGYIARADGPLGQVNDRYLQNVGYLRLKNLSIGYSIPLGRKQHFIEKCRFSLNGENLWYWSPLKKYCKTVDPELAISGSTNATNTGVGYFYSRVFSFNVDLTF